MQNSGQSTRRVLVIGGSIGERHTRCFQKTGRADVCCAKLTTTYAIESRAFGLSASFRPLMPHSQESFDAAVIAQLCMFQMARQLAERDVNLLIEKPLSTSARRY